MNPYSDFFDPTDVDFSLNVHMFLWMPEPSYFTQGLLLDTTVVAICDIGILEFQKQSEQIDFEFLRSCYQFSPSKLHPQKKEKLIELIGEILGGTFILAAVIPKAFLGAGLRNPQVSYESIMNIIFLPLVVAHSQLGCKHFSVSLKESNAKFVTSTSKKMMKSAFGSQQYSLILEDTSDKFCEFYFYAAKLISWAVGRSYVYKEEKWLTLLKRAFKV
jgi:hypothetical protein